MVRQILSVSTEMLGITRSIQRSWAAVSQCLEQAGNFCKANPCSLMTVKKNMAQALVLSCKHAVTGMR